MMMRTLTYLLLAGAMGATLVFAADPQPAAPAGGGPGGPRGGGFGGPGGFPGRGGPMGLDEAQRQAFQEALQKEDAKLRELNEKLREAQKELLKAVLAEDYDEKVVRTKAEAVAAVEVEIILIRGKALASVAPSLKPEQKEQMMNSPLGAMLLSSGPGGGRPGMPMGGPGGPPGGPGFQGGGRGGPGGPGGDGFPGAGRERPPRER